MNSNYLKILQRNAISLTNIMKMIITIITALKIIIQAAYIVQ